MSMIQTIRITIMVLILTLLMTVLIGASTYYYLDQYIHRPLALEQSMILEIKPGDTLTSLLQSLYQQTIIDHPQWVLFWAKYQQLTDIKVGEYPLDKGVTLLDLMNMINKGQSIAYQVTLLEGWTFKQALAHLHQQPKLIKKLANLNDAKIRQAIEIKANYLEGMFFPDTYQYTHQTSDIDLLKKAHQRLMEVLNQAWRSRQQELPFNDPLEALILASIVEKETGFARERREIAGVFVRRLEKNMRLQTDPTVIYGLGDKFDGNLKRSHLQQDTPYNTYKIKGLPPTPIALSSQAAIEAVLSPAPGTSLYFVAKGDGTSIFSDTLEAHNNAVKKYQKQRNLNYRSTPK